MAKKMFIPTKIKVGFQERRDTFTGKLAYVTYFDEKNVLRKQTSWDGWRDKKITPIEFDNLPRNGYLFNKGVQRDGHWGSGRSVIRVYDPRDFEFEISVDNLIGILMHSDISKRDIVEECVFAWYGTDLVLLPVNSMDYQASLDYTVKQSQKVSAKELIKGCQYHKKKSDEILTYVGFYDWNEISRDNKGTVTHAGKGKKHVFYDGKYFTTPSVSTLSSLVSSDVVDDYAFLVDKFFSTKESQTIVGTKIVPFNMSELDENKWYNPPIYRWKDGRIEAIQVPSGRYAPSIEWRYCVYHISKQDNTTKFVAEMEDGHRYYSYSTYKKYAHYTMKSDLENIFLSKGWDINNITKEQLYSALESLGYGRLALVLQNGKEVIFNL